MRYATEANAKMIELALEERIARLKALNSPSLRVANQIRLTQIALTEFKKSKTSHQQQRH